jgi:chemotaxis protein methyltransferase CheR
MAIKRRITPQHLQRLRDLVTQRIGLDLDQRMTVTPMDLLEQVNVRDIDAFLRELAVLPVDSHVWQQVIDLLTVGETYFFRNQTQFAILRDHILPTIIEQNQHTRRLIVWSVGCATGEEAYSLALALTDQLTRPDEWVLNIIGTDVNRKALDTARAGVYRQWSFRHGDTQFVEDFFEQVPQGYQLRADVRGRVTFRYGNVLDGGASQWVDLILCRNVLLYFTGDAKRRAERHLLSALKPRGWLLLGHAEALHAAREQWTTHVFSAAVAYQKLATPQADTPYRIHGSLGRNGPVTVHPRRERDPVPAYEDALHAFHLKQYERAEQLLADILSFYPNDPPARVLLAAVFANQGAAPESALHLDMVLAQNPLHADAHYLRAVLYLETNQPDLAQKSLRAAIYSKRGHPLAAFMLGNLQAGDGDISRARNLWQQALVNARALPPGARLADFSPYTAGDFASIIASQLD